MVISDCTQLHELLHTSFWVRSTFRTCFSNRLFHGGFLLSILERTFRHFKQRSRRMLRTCCTMTLWLIFLACVYTSSVTAVAFSSVRVHLVCLLCFRSMQLQFLNTSRHISQGTVAKRLII